jgi:hypothetical protein
MTPPAERRSRGSRSWVKGCAVGCVLLLLLIALVGAGGYVLVNWAAERIKGIETVMETVRERHGDIGDFCPDPDGSVSPERLEAFLKVRELMAPARTEAERTLALLSDGGRESLPRVRGGILGRLWGWAVGVRTAEAGAGLLPQLLQFVSRRGEALLEAEMGLGEYYYIYSVVYYSWLGKSPADGPAFPFMGGDGDTGGRDEFAAREHRRELVLRRLNRLVLPMLRRQLAALDAAPRARASAEWRARLAAEIEAMEESSYRIPWREGLPASVESSLRPFRGRLSASYSAMCNPLEVLGGGNDG